jgi:DNA repair protein RadC
MERPRERLVKYGPSALADYELLAIILRTGTKESSVIEVARNLTSHYNSLNDLNEATISELKSIKGIGATKAIELLAVVEIGKRIVTPIKYENVLTTPEQSYQYLKRNMQNLSQETLVCVFLNTRNEVIADKVLSIGTLDRTIIHPRDVLKWALKYSAYGIIISHNHPSGDSHPSDMDVKMTKLMIEASQTVGVVFVDHIIIGKNQYYSFVEKKKKEI